MEPSQALYTALPSSVLGGDTFNGTEFKAARGIGSSNERLLSLVESELVRGGDMSVARARNNVATKLENRTLLLSDRPRRSPKPSSSSSVRIGRKRTMDGGVAPSLSNRKLKRALGGEFPARIDLQTNSRGDAGKESYAGQAESESGAKGSHEKRNDDNGDSSLCCNMATPNCAQ